MKKKLKILFDVVIVLIIFSLSVYFTFLHIKTNDIVEYKIINNNPTIVLEIVNEVPTAILVVTTNLDSARAIISKTDDDMCVKTNTYQLTDFGYVFRIEH